METPAAAVLDVEDVLTLTFDSVVFAHAVNTREKLAFALASPEINFIEADVICAADGKTPVMGHNSGHPEEADFPLAELLASVQCRGVGLKIDLKEWSIVPAVLALLCAQFDELMARGEAPWPMLRLEAGAAFFSRPALIVNADVLTGTADAPRCAAGGAARGGCAFNPHSRVQPREEQLAHARAFVERVGAALPAALLSLGWTTVAQPVDAEGRLIASPTYSDAALDDMAALLADFTACGVPFTLAVRAEYLPRAFPRFRERLLAPSALTSITLWSHAPPTADELGWMRASLDPRRVMYDLAGGARPSDAAGGGAAARAAAADASRARLSSALAALVGAAAGAALAVLLVRAWTRRRL